MPAGRWLVLRDASGSVQLNVYRERTPACALAIAVGVLSWNTRLIHDELPPLEASIDQPEATRRACVHAGVGVNRCRPA